MPQADANAFKVLKRNHALLNRKSRGRFDIRQHNKKVKTVSLPVRLTKMTDCQKSAIANKIRNHKIREKQELVISVILTVIITSLAWWIMA